MFRRLFEEVVRQCVEKGLVIGKLMATDSTHVKANMSRASEYLDEVRREIGGLGIYIVKNTMGDVTYEYKDGKNILRIRKNIPSPEHREDME